MYFIILILLFIIPLTRFLIFHFFHITLWAPIDIYYYFKHKEYNRCPYYGRVDIVTAQRNKVFGSGKTLDITMICRSIYSKYNGLPVWDDQKNDFVIQHIHIISNVSLRGVPYTKFVSPEQFMNIEQGSQDVTIFLFDEIGILWNSRDYKNNISTSVLNELLQSRKNRMYILGSSQRFRFVDALLRQITGRLYAVKKTWRILSEKEYDPFDYENATNSSMIRPIATCYRWVSNRDYASYDTSEKVSEWLKLDMLPDDAVLQNQGNYDPDLQQVRHGSRRLRRRIAGKR